MREPERQTFYLVGTPKGRINQHEKKRIDLPWQKVRDSVEVKLYQHEGELYVLAKSSGRQAKEMGMRRKRLSRFIPTRRSSKPPNSAMATICCAAISRRKIRPCYGAGTCS